MSMEHRHFILHKPYGFKSQFISNERKKKSKLLSELDFDFPKGTMSIGRLDVASEGLLLLTTDGKVSYALRAKTVEKEYHVLVDGLVTEEAIEQLKMGVEIGIQGKKYKTLPCQVSLLLDPPKFPMIGWKIRDARHGPTSWIRVVLTEGKYRQVRKMTAAVGFPTLRLIRVRVGGIHLNDLAAGEIVEVPSLISK
jgi:23S rRNA pseudouridine2457 synthase